MGRWRGKRWGGEVRGGGPAVVGRRLQKGWWEGGCGRGRGDVRDQRALFARITRRLGWRECIYVD